MPISQIFIIFAVVMWTMPKDINYYDRLALVNRVKKHVIKTMDWETPFTFDPQIPFSYVGGAKYILNIERHKYISVFKREFTTIWCRLSDDTYVRLIDLRTKHLIEIYKQLKK